MDTHAMKSCGCPDEVINHPQVAAIPPAIWALLLDIAQTVGSAVWIKVKAYLDTLLPTP